jgi:hypothetical protein
MSNCRSCTAPITWVYTQGGQRTPLDEQPEPAGEWVLIGRTTVRKAQPDDDPKLRFVSHWATCPDASKWRRRR